MTSATFLTENGYPVCARHLVNWSHCRVVELPAEQVGEEIFGEPGEIDCTDCLDERAERLERAAKRLAQ